MTQKTVREIRRLSNEWLEKKGIKGEKLSVDLLLARVLGIDRLKLIMELDRPLLSSELDAFRELLRRRGGREPLAYILGQREFYSLPFKVTQAVLIPRPETEFLVDLGREVLDAKPDETTRWADIGTGSGCVAVALVRNLKGPNQGFAVDLSADALAVAKGNAELNEVTEEQLTFLEGDLCAPLKEHGPFDLIVSNPPYISPAERPALEPEVCDHEPSMALFDDAEDGLDLTRRLASEARELLKPGGVLAIELGAGRVEAARAMLLELGYSDLQVVRDYARHERVIAGTWSP